MKKLITILFLTLFLIVFANVGWSQYNAGLALINDADIDKASARTIFTLTQYEIEKYKIVIIPSSKLEKSKNQNDVIVNARSLNVGVIFILETRKLGKKIIFILTKFHNGNGRVLYKSSLTSLGVEEADKIVPRIVKSVVMERQIEQTATVSSVTKKEAEKYNKKPGEFFWGFCIISSLFTDESDEGYENGKEGLGCGGGLRLYYEMEDHRIGMKFEGFGNGGRQGAFFGVEGDYLFSQKNVSPFVGLALGFCNVSNGEGYETDTTLGLELIAGIEFFRLYGTRLILDVQVLFPFEEAKRKGYSYYYSYPHIYTQEDDSKYLPLIYAGISFVW